VRGNDSIIREAFFIESDFPFDPFQGERVESSACLSKWSDMKLRPRGTTILEG
jgi:hypothetical protein